MKATKLLVLAAVAAGGILANAAPASAVPVLQLYLEGATYDATTDTWVVEGGSDPLRLWAIGNVAGPGGKGTIYDVKLAVAYAAGETPNIDLIGSTTNNLNNFDDPSNPGNILAPSKTVTDGSLPKLGDGSDLPSHGIYGAGTWWQEFLLGDFNKTDSPIADFIDAFPTVDPSAALQGQISVFEVNKNGFTGDLHFDLYNHVGSATKVKYVFAPFSHDAEGGTTEVPEPGSFLLFGSALAALAGAARRRASQA